MRYVYPDRYVRITGEWGYGTWGTIPDPIPDGTVAWHSDGYYVYHVNGEWLKNEDSTIATIGAGDSLVEWVAPQDLNAVAQRVARYIYIMRTTDGMQKQGAKNTWMTGMDKTLLTRFVAD